MSTLQGASEDTTEIQNGDDGKSEDGGDNYNDVDDHDAANNNNDEKENEWSTLPR